MEKRPLSLTIISVILVIFALLGLYGVATMGSNPLMLKMIQQMHSTVAFQQTLGVIGAVINLVCVYGIWKGLPWSRVLYLVWGIIGLVISAYTSPNKAVLVLALIILVVVCIFLWTNNANDWFAARGFMLKRERAR